MIFLAIAAVIVALDQLLKHWVVTHIALGDTLAVWPGVFHLTYIQNTGAAFSIMQDMRLILLIITALCVALILVFLFRGTLNRICKLSLAFVLGGAIGNAIDRMLLHYVVDMFEVEFMHYAVFNVADCFVVVGGIAFCIFYYIHSTKMERHAKKAEVELHDDPNSNSGD